MTHQLHILNKGRNSTVRLACFITLLVLTTAVPSPIWAVDCTPLAIGLYTQADVDNFQNNHGPCDRVLTLYIEGAEITNLDGLAALINIGSSLNIENNAALTSVDGLSSLTSIGRNLWIQNNAQLTNLDGLSTLTSVGEVLGILYNDALRNVNGLSTLTSVGASLGIVENNVLTNVDGLSALTSVGGYEGSEMKSLLIQGNDALTNLDGLSALTTVGNFTGGYSAVSILDNTTLTNVNGLSALTNISGDLIIVGNTALTNLDGLSALTHVIVVSVSSNDALIDLDGLSSLTSVQGLGIGSNDSLINVDGLSTLTTVWGDLQVQSNRALTNLDGLSAVTYVGSKLDVQSNEVLAGCSGLSHLVDQWDDAEPGPGPGAGRVPDVGGEVLLGDNLAGCNSIEEILAGVDISKINAGLNDAWYDPITDGQGFFIAVFPDLGKVSLAWFTYDTELPPIDAVAHLGDPGHRWLTAQGKYDGNQAVLRIILTSGGIFDTPTDVQRTDPRWSDGSLTLTFDSCNSGTVEYDIPSINQQGIVPITRIAGDNIALCEALSSE